jgi:hypothetical protein
MYPRAVVNLDPEDLGQVGADKVDDDVGAVLDTFAEEEVVIVPLREGTGTEAMEEAAGSVV